MHKLFTKHEDVRTEYNSQSMKRYNFESDNIEKTIYIQT